MTTVRPTHTDPEAAPLAPIAIGLGLIMLIAALAALNLIPGWAADYGTTLIAMAIVIHLSLTAYVLCWGVAQLGVMVNRGRLEIQ
ncbi:hypothetical protein [Nocardia sp. NPDC005998]|uniref:hypothetical protein n=1 Tax=Nocardia sp. NPDC005998 TaxID=3156894 RepID=UPI0033ABC55F